MKPQNYKQVLLEYDQCPKKIQSYFEHLPSLIEKYPWDIAVNYAFSKIETAKRTTIYMGIVKIHSGNAELSWNFVKNYYMSRDQFKRLFDVVYGKSIDKSLMSKLNDAEDIRDKVAHGHEWQDSNARSAISDILKFATEFNKFVATFNVLEPFGDLRGFKGAAKGLEKPTTRWLLLGIAAEASKKSSGA